MSWLPSFYLGHKVNRSLARQTADLKGRPPATAHSFFVGVGWIAGVCILVGMSVLLNWLGVESNLVISLLVLAGSIFGGALVTAWLEETVN